jgi:TM2 domain-containing membrane protein YozV
MKSKSTAILLLLFFGGLGAHKFYLGNNLLGVLYLVFCWSGIPLFLSIIDLVILASTDKKKFNDKYNQEYKEWLYAQE